jgi:peptidoglycan hydrolase-like protein with peptidoglycan-binding domain
MKPTTTTAKRTSIIRRLAVVAAGLAVAVSSTLAVTVATAPEAEAASCSTTTVKYGSRGTCVKELQKRLGGLKADGVFGTGTRARVRAFQADTGLSVDGVAGRNTWAKLNRFGTAIGWVRGATLYVCRRSSTHLYFSLWNNTGKTAAWEYRFAGGVYHTLNGTRTNTVKRFSFASTRASFDSRKVGVWVGTVSRDTYRSTTNVRDFRRSSLRTCA